jgi:hypothetical protein
MSTWYMTVGVPGGEYASQDGTGDELLQHHVVKAAVALGARILIRPCPPDLVEWIEAEDHDYHETNAGIGRMKITGGWLYEVHDAQNLNPPEEYPNYNVVVHATERAPVAGAAGLTVLDVI